MSENSVRIDIRGDAESFKAAAREAGRELNSLMQAGDKVAEATKRQRDEAEKYLVNLQKESLLLGQGEAARRRLEVSLLNITDAQRQQAMAVIDNIEAYKQSVAEQERMEVAGRRMGAAIGAAAVVVVTALAKITYEAVQAAMAAEQVDAKLNAVLRATGHSAGLARSEIDDLAESMQKATIFDDDKIKNAAAVMLTYRNVQGETFKEGMKMAAGMSAVMGNDLVSAARLVGQALNEPAQALGALTRAGLQFSPAQKDVIKDLIDTGRFAEAQTVILDELRKKYGTAAEEMNTGYTKATGELTKEWNDLLKAFGNTPAVSVTTIVALYAITGQLQAIRAVLQGNLTDIPVLLRMLPGIGSAIQGYSYGLRQRSTGEDWSVSVGGREARLAREAAAQQRLNRQMEQEDEITKRNIATLDKWAEAAKRAAESRAKAEEGAVRSLHERLMQAEGLSETEKTLWEIENGRYKDFARHVKDRLIGEARLIDATKEALRAAKSHNEEVSRELELEERHRMAVENSIAGTRRRIEQIEFETSLIGLSNAERERAIVLHELEAHKTLLTADAYEQLRQRIEAALLTKAAKQSAFDAASTAAKEWAKIYDNLEKGLTDSLFRGFEAGKSFLESFKDTIRNTFKSLALTLMVRPILQPMYAGMASLFGVDMSQAGGSWATQAAGAGNLFSTGSNAFNLFSNGATALTNTALYSTFGGASLEQAAMLAAQDAVFGSAGTAATLEALGSGSAGLLSSIGAALPYIGVALAIASMLGGDGGGPKIEGNAIGQFATGGKFNILTSGAPGTAPYGDGDWGRPGGDAASIGKIVTALSGDVDKLIEGLGGVTDGLQLFLGYNSDPQGDAPDGVASGVKNAAGDWVYHTVYDVGRGEAADALTEESKKLMIAAVAAAEGIDEIYKAIAAGVDLTTASAADIEAALGQITTAQTALENSVELFGLELSVGLLQRIAEEGESVGDTITRITEEFTELRSAVAAAEQTVAALKTVLYNLARDQAQFNAGIKATLFGLGASPGNGAGFLKQAVQADFTRIGDLTAAGDSGGALEAVKAGVSDVGAWLASKTAKINADLQTSIDAVKKGLSEALKPITDAKKALADDIAGLEAERDLVGENIDARIEGLQKELQLAQQWQGVLQSAEQALKNMLLSSANPASAEERFGLAQAETERLKAALAGASGEERSQIAADLIQALNQELQMAQQIWDRPSLEYQAEYDRVQAGLQSVAGIAAGQQRDAAALQQEIADLQQEQVDRLAAIDEQIRALTRQSEQLDSQAIALQSEADAQIAALQSAANDRLAAAQAEAAAFYKQLQDLGNGLYEQIKVDARTQLATAEATLFTAQTQLDVAVANLQVNQAILDAINANGAAAARPLPVDAASVPGFAGGLDFVPRDNYLARLHYGERVQTAAEARAARAGGGNTTITFAPVITVQGGGDPKAAAAEMEKALLRLVPVLKERLKTA